MDLHAVIGLLLKTLELLADVSSMGSFVVGLAALFPRVPKRDSSREREEREGGRGRKGPRKQIKAGSHPGLTAPPA